MFNGDPYKYDDVNVMRNMVNIKDTDKLERFERDITVKRLAEIDNAVSGEFNYNRLLNTHKHIFERIYDWAGSERTVQMLKEEPVLGGDSVRYSHPSSIKQDAKNAIKKMNAVDWDKLDVKSKAMEMSKRVSELWQVHPFREGNTRTVITFACQFSDAKGFPINRKHLQQHSSYVRNALVKACDGEYSDYHYLANVFEDAITGKQVPKQKKQVEKEYEYER